MSNWKEKVTGWFIVREEDENEGESPPEAAPAKPARKLAPPYTRPAPPPPPDDAPPSIRLPGNVPEIAAGAPIDNAVFAEVFTAAEISAEEQERVTKALTLLQSLPAETSHQVRKQIVEASLKAFGIPIESIIESGVQEIQALDAYIHHGERKTQDILQQATARIEKLTAEVEEIRKLMELQVRSQGELVRASNAEKLRVQGVLEFFGQEAVERVVRESPKLVVPQPPQAPPGPGPLPDAPDAGARPRHPPRRG